MKIRKLKKEVMRIKVLECSIIFKIMMFVIACACNQFAACQSVESSVISDANEAYYISGKDTIYKKVDVLPEFISGKGVRLMWLRRNVKMPTLTQEAGAYGDVVCQFVVKIDSTITDVQFVSYPDEAVKKEVKRNIPLMEKWTPGTIDGRPVNTLYTMIINFRRTGCVFCIEFK